MAPSTSRPGPAVFLFNHQSQLDVLILAKLLRGGFTGVAKKELANSPGFGLMFRLADVAFVDRQDNAQARKALEPAVRKLRDGISLVIAPEGTRSATPALGPFKKGAFHVAMQAGVPIVPIVIRNSGELMWRGATTIHAGTVQVAVLSPVATEGWDVAGLTSTYGEVRGQYLATLARLAGARQRAGDGHDDGRSEPPPAVPLDWGASPRMNPLETAMWRAESADPRLRVTVSLLELLDPAPDWDRLLAAHEWASRMVPRMRQRVLAEARRARYAGLGDGRRFRPVPARAPGAAARPRHAAATARRGAGVSPPLRSTVTARCGRRCWWRALPTAGPGSWPRATTASPTASARSSSMMRLHSRTAEHDPDRPEPPVPAAGEGSRTGLFAGQVATRSAPPPWRRCARAPGRSAR